MKAAIVQQTVYAYKGIDTTTDAAPIVGMYLEQQVLTKKYGYRFDPGELEDWEVEAMMLIEETIGKESSKEMKARRR